MGEQLVFRNREKDGKGECVTEGEELSDEQKATMKGRQSSLYIPMPSSSLSRQIASIATLIAVS